MEATFLTASSQIGVTTPTAAHLNHLLYILLCSTLAELQHYCALNALDAAKQREQQIDAQADCAHPIVAGVRRDARRHRTVARLARSICNKIIFY